MLTKIGLASSIPSLVSKLYQDYWCTQLEIIQKGKILSYII